MSFFYSIPVNSKPILVLLYWQWLSIWRKCRDLCLCQQFFIYWVGQKARSSFSRTSYSCLCNPDKSWWWLGPGWYQWWWQVLQFCTNFVGELIVLDGRLNMEYVRKRLVKAVCKVVGSRKWKRGVAVYWVGKHSRQVETRNVVLHYAWDAVRHSTTER